MTFGDSSTFAPIQRGQLDHVGGLRETELCRKLFAGGHPQYDMLLRNDLGGSSQDFVCTYRAVQYAYRVAISPFQQLRFGERVNGHNAKFPHHILNVISLKSIRKLFDFLKNFRTSIHFRIENIKSAFSENELAISSSVLERKSSSHFLV